MSMTSYKLVIFSRWLRGLKGDDIDHSWRRGGGRKRDGTVCGRCRRLTYSHTRLSHCHQWLMYDMLAGCLRIWLMRTRRYDGLLDVDDFASDFSGGPPLMDCNAGEDEEY
jgi:hypothetical protein